MPVPGHFVPEHGHIRSIMRKNSIKNTRINGEVQKALSEIIRELKDPRIHPMTSVVLAQVTPDLKFCKVYYSNMSGEDIEVKSGLYSAIGYIRHELSSRLSLRITPELTFIRDTGAEHGARISELLKSIKTEKPGENPDENSENN